MPDQDYDLASLNAVSEANPLKAYDNEALFKELKSRFDAVLLLGLNKDDASEEDENADECTLWLIKGSRYTCIGLCQQFIHEALTEQI